MEINCTYALDITNSVTVVIFITVIWIFVRLSGLFGLFGFEPVIGCKFAPKTAISERR